jgi:hypothetical protein
VSCAETCGSYLPTVGSRTFKWASNKRRLKQLHAGRRAIQQWGPQRAARSQQPRSMLNELRSAGQARGWQCRQWHCMMHELMLSTRCIMMHHGLNATSDTQQMQLLQRHRSVTRARWAQQLLQAQQKRSPWSSLNLPKTWMPFPLRPMYSPTRPRYNAILSLPVAVYAHRARRSGRNTKHGAQVLDPSQPRDHRGPCNGRCCGHIQPPTRARTTGHPPMSPGGNK